MVAYLYPERFTNLGWLITNLLWKFRQVPVKLHKFGAGK